MKAQSINSHTDQYMYMYRYMQLLACSGTWELHRRLFLEVFPISSAVLWGGGGGGGQAHHHLCV